MRINSRHVVWALSYPGKSTEQHFAGTCAHRKLYNHNRRHHHYHVIRQERLGTDISRTFSVASVPPRTTDAVTQVLVYRVTVFETVGLICPTHSTYTRTHTGTEDHKRITVLHRSNRLLNMLRGGCFRRCLREWTREVLVEQFHPRTGSAPRHVKKRGVYDSSCLQPSNLQPVHRPTAKKTASPWNPSSFPTCLPSPVQTSLRVMTAASV